MKNQPRYVPLSSSESAQLRSYLSRGDGFYHIPSSDIPSVIPGDLRAKWDSAAVLISGSTGPDGALLIVGHRIDAKAGMMDHDPFAIAVSASVPTGSGVLVHHASFHSRSIALPAEYRAALESSGLSNYFLKKPPFGASSGSTSEAPAALVAAFEVARSFLSSSAA